MNPILKKCYENRLNYCHVVEVDSVSDLTSILDALFDELQENYKFPDILDFCTSLTVYCLNEDNEDEVYSFDVETYLKELI